MSESAWSSESHKRSIDLFSLKNRVFVLRPLRSSCLLLHKKFSSFAYRCELRSTKAVWQFPFETRNCDILHLIVWINLHFQATTDDQCPFEDVLLFIEFYFDVHSVFRIVSLQFETLRLWSLFFRVSVLCIRGVIRVGYWLIYALKVTHSNFASVWSAFRRLVLLVSGLVWSEVDGFMWNWFPGNNRMSFG